MATITLPPKLQKTTASALQKVPAQSITDFCKRHQVRELLLFGSAVRGELGPDSDLDILVAFEPEARVGFMTLGRMTRELSDLLGRTIDLVPKDGLKASIREAVLAEAVSLFAA